MVDHEPLAERSSALTAAALLVTAPLAGVAAGYTCFMGVAAVVGYSLFGGASAAAALSLGLLCLAFFSGLAPAVWIVCLVASWRRLGQDRLSLVRYSPPVLAAVFILTAIAAANMFLP
jgi:hypothetical protein